MKNSIIVKIRGGLGNQLFQYAYAKKIQTKYPDKEIIIDTSYFNKKHIRSLEINQLILRKKVKMQNRSDKIFDFLYNIFRFLDKISKHSIVLNAIYLFGNYYCFCDKQVTFNLNRKKVKNIYLAGYFQDLREIDPIKDSIKKDIIPSSLSETTKRYLQYIYDNNTIAVSIRAGDDYVKFGWPVCTKDYYLAAINKLRKHNEKIIVFADVIDKIKKEKWFDNYEVTYIEGCNAVESLFLLSRCNDYVISNSTFSWWGAYLGDNDNKKIVAPEMFYSGKKMSEGGLHIPGALYMNNYTGKPCK